MIFLPKNFHYLEFTQASGYPFQMEKFHEQPMVVMVGYSNVGKSSLINVLCNKKIAHVSKNPGKTQSINTYSHPNAPFCLIDLPGFGFANVAGDVKGNWNQMMEDFFQKITSEAIVVNIVDGRRGLRELDTHMEQYALELNLEFLRVFNKGDQLNQSEKSKLKGEILISTKEQKDFKVLLNKLESLISK